MTHSLERTSPKGEEFIGRCTKCGRENLKPLAAMRPCSADLIVSNEAALLGAIEGRDASASLEEFEEKGGKSLAQIKSELE